MKNDEHFNDDEVTRRDAFLGLSNELKDAFNHKFAYASDAEVTKKQAADVSFKIADFKTSEDKYERTKNKVTVIDKSSSDDTYPTAKAIYEFLSDKLVCDQGKANAGNALFIDADGTVVPKTYVVDTELSEKSSNPVQGKVVYEAIKEINDRIVVDEKPKKNCDNSNCDKQASDESAGIQEDNEKRHKHITTSGAVYDVYQEVHNISILDSTLELTTLQDTEIGVTYKVQILNDTLYFIFDNYAFQKFSESPVCGIYLSEDENGVIKAVADSKVTYPKYIWHS